MTERKQITHEEIAHYAYLLWEQEGKPEGKDVEHWRKAERILAQSVKNVPPKAPTRIEKLVKPIAKKTRTKTTKRTKSIGKKRASGKRTRKSSPSK